MREGQPFLRVPLDGGTQVRRQTPREAGAEVNRAIRRASAAVMDTAGEKVVSTLLGPAVAPMVAPLMNRQSVVAAREFVEGAASGQGTKAARKAPAAPKAAKPAGATAAAGAAPRQGLKIMPQDRQMAFLDAAFRQGVTIREAAALTGMLPATGKAPTAKDQVYNQAALASEALYANQRAQAEKLAAAGDMEGAAALELKATETAFQRFAMLLGADPLQQALADRTAEAEAQ